jgi:hypothetical protein
MRGRKERVEGRKRKSIKILLCYLQVIECECYASDIEVFYKEAMRVW